MADGQDAKPKKKSVALSGVPAGEYYDKEIIGKGEKQFKSRGAGGGHGPGDGHGH